MSVDLEFEDHPALLIGAGEVGRRKLNMLIKAGAKVRVVEPNPSQWLLEMAAMGQIRLEKFFNESFLDDLPWVFLAARNLKNEDELITLIHSRGLWLNIADRPDKCNFIIPAVIDDPPFRISIGTGGTSPALAARVAAELRERYKGYGFLSSLMGRLRPLILSSGLPEESRKKIFRDLSESEALAKLLASGEEVELRELITRLIDPVFLPIDIKLT